MQFRLEPLNLAFIEEAIPLFQRHFQEVSRFHDIKLNPSYDKYLTLQERGVLRLYTGREDAGDLVAYAIFVVDKNIRYSDSLQANQDLLFLHPEKQKLGFGSKFIEFIEAEIKAEGVQVIYHHVKKKPELDFSPLLARRGYEEVDMIWAKRLDKEKT